MGTNSRDDIRLLNALVDGEVSPAERAQLAGRLATDREFARAHATLARLKACIVETADATPAVRLPPPPVRPRRAVLGFGLSAAAAIIFAVAVVATDRPPHRQPLWTAVSQPPVTLAAMGALPVIPDLSDAGLRLTSVATETIGQAPAVVVSYRGPRGCRVELRVRPASAATVPSVGTIRRTWTIGEVAYELIAFGMPAQRFERIADATLLLIQSGQPPQLPNQLLREARVMQSPCLG